MNTLQQARSKRDQAMGLAAVGAGETWASVAYDALVAYAAANDAFMAEDVRLACPWVPKPSDNRAWGPVFNRAARANVIKRIGYGQAITGHCRPMPIWGRAA